MKRYLFLILCCWWLTSVSAITITKTTCNYQQGMALVVGDAVVGWQMTSARNEDHQTAYQILLRERVTNDTLYYTDKIQGSESQFIHLPELVENRYGYTWQVRVWDSEDDVSLWSAPQVLRVMPKKIDAKWIGTISKEEARIPEGRYSNAVFKKDYFKNAWKDVDTLSSKSIMLQNRFRLKKDIADAIVHVCGLGFYELDINGVKVGDSELAPLWSEYTKTVYYNTYDVTSQLRSGANTISVLLGNGFYNVQRGNRYSKLQMSFGTPKLLLRMEIHYTDGTSQVVQSDESWKWCLSAITFNSIYGGESYDARKETDQEWYKVRIVEEPEGKLTPQMAPPIKIMERYPAVDFRVRNAESGIIVADMGQNLAGFPEISLSGKRGQTVRMYVSEKLGDNGLCDQKQTGRPHYYEYTLKGDGRDTWHPRFSYYGFRYIQLEGVVMQGEPNPNNLPVVYALNSCFIYNSAEEVSRFHCSNDLFNKTHRLIERAERSNMQAVLSDCPHREKLGWLEQDHLNGKSLLYNYNLTTFVPKIIRDITDTQKDNGMVPTTAPQYTVFSNPATPEVVSPFDDSPEWSSTLVILPYMYYEQYGDSTLITNNYQSMKRYMDYLASRADNHILDYGLGDWYDYDGGRSGFSKNTPIALVATAHYIYNLQIMQRAAVMTGQKADSAYYHTLCDTVTKRFNEEFYRADSCSYAWGSQCANALPLFLGICGENKEAVLETLIADIRKHGNRLTTGDVGNRYLIQALAQNGRNDIVYEMFNHDEAPGYGYQLKFGATTLTEQWDPRHGSSWNHFMMGQIDEWFFTSLAGIRQKEGTYGMRHLVIQPYMPEEMTELSASTETIYGQVSVKIEKNKHTNNKEIRVTIPVGCDADIVTPEETYKVGSGSYLFNFN